MPQKLFVLTALAILVLPFTSSGDAADLDKYLDHLTDKKADFVFVFDTSNSMGGEINELRAVANKFASDLEAYHIDYKLGLVEYRDFPLTCGEGKKIQCGSPGDFEYNVKGNGTLTSEISTFSSWLDELKAGGGGSGGPEAVLVALRHAGSDMTWRDDAEKEIILLTDAGPHPDGSCCNAEGDTLEGTIFGLAHLGVRVNIIGPDEASLKKIAKDTGGQFFMIRSGLSLRPLLEKITEAMSYSFNVSVEATCENGTLETKVQLVGKEAMPYLYGQTAVWMYLDQARNRSRYNLSYVKAASAYQGKIEDVCGPVDLVVYGRVGESSAVQTVQVECESCRGTTEMQVAPNQPPEIVNLVAEPASSQDAGANVTWTASASDPDGDPILYRFFIDDEPMTSWITEKTWTWTADVAGSYRIDVQVRDGNHAGPNGLDDREIESYAINEPETAEQANEPSIITDLKAVQDKSTDITWAVSATDHDNDRILAKFFLNNKSVTDWTTSNTWTLNVTDTNVGDNQVEVQIRDGKHTVPEGYDDARSVRFKLSSRKLMVQTWEKALMDSIFPNSVQQTADGGYIVAGSGGGQLMKTDSYGNTIWRANFGGGECIYVQQTSDRGYIVVGHNLSSQNADYDIWLIKTDEDGNMVWDKTFGGYGEDFGLFVQQTGDGGYIIASMTTSFSESHMDAWVIKTDSAGNEEWDKTYGKTSAKSVLQTDDGGYIIIGSNGLENNSWLMKVDSRGNKEWLKAIRGVWSSGQETNDDGYIICGIRAEAGDSLLTKTDAKGNELWHRTLSGSEAHSVRQTTDGGYIVAGGSSSAWIIKTDANGNEEWNRTLSGSEVNSVQQTDDGGYIVVGDRCFIKTDANGYV